MKIKHKLILSFLLVATLASVTMLFSLRSYNEIDTTFNILIDDSTQMVQALTGLKEAGLQIVSSTGELKFIHSEALRSGRTDVEEEAEVNHQIEAGHQSYSRSLEKYQGLVRTIANDEAETLNNITISGNNLLKTSDEIIELNKRRVPGDERIEKREKFENEEVVFSNYVDEALKRESAEQAEGQSNVYSSIDVATHRTIVVTVLTFLLAIFSGVYVSFHLSRRIGKLRQASERVGEGDLDTQIDVESGDEIGDLARSFNNMVGDLRGSRADLAAREKHFRSMIEKSTDGVALFTLDGTVLYASPSTPRLLGYSPDEITGMNAAELVPPDEKEEFGKRLGKLVGEPGSSIQMINRVRHKDGSLRWLEGTFTNLLADPDIGAIVNNYRDVTARKRSESERQVISQIVEGVATTENLDELLHLIRRSIGQILNADNCYVALYEAKTDLISVPFCIDKYDVVDASPVKMGTGLTAYVLRNGQAMLMTPEVIRDLTEKGEIACLGTVPAIWLGVPLRTPEGTIGALVVQHYEDVNTYSQMDVEFLSSVGDQIALAIERKRTEDERLKSENRFKDLFDNAPVAYHELDIEGRYTRINRTEELLLGYTNDELRGRHPWEIIVETSSRSATADKLAGRIPLEAVERTFIRKDGSHVSVLNEDRLIYDDKGAVTGIRTTLQDITTRKTLEEQLTHQALHDPLTKLGNRVLFRDRVEHAVRRTERSHTPIAVMFLDLDHFKSINDSLGHAAGDELLVSVTERLQACLRPSDTPARLGGDEFAILLEDLPQPDQAAFIAERIRGVMAAPFFVAGTEVFISSSIGIALTINGRETPEELLRNADVAMYTSKNNGRNRYTIFENQMHDVLIERVRLESDMRLAIEKREFEVYYQPIMDLQEEKVMGMEALVRWNHPLHGLIPPLDFIPLAEETGLIVPLGNWILETACTQARKWQTEYQCGEDLSITVNVASRQFEDDGLSDIVEQALASSGLPPRSLILEITESTMLANTETTINKLLELRKLGIRFAIDDFGTGYSSLSYLQRFPVDILKIDKSFIDKIAMDREGAAVASAIITMSGTLNLKTIAEGIESLGQKAVLQNLGCELGQGYHFAKPLKAKAMGEFLRHSLEDDNSPSVISVPANRNGKRSLATVR